MPDPLLRPPSADEWHDLQRQLQQPAGAQPAPFFYERVRARLLARTAPRPLALPQWLRRPAYALLLGGLVLALSGDGGSAAPSQGRLVPVQHPSLP